MCYLGIISGSDLGSERVFKNMKRQVNRQFGGTDSVRSYRSLLIKVWSQLQQPSRLNSSDISHIILGGLYNFIVDNPETRKTHELISYICGCESKITIRAGHLYYMCILCARHCIHKCTANKSVHFTDDTWVLHDF